MRTRSPAQASMETEWITRIYESRLWRRNAIIGLLQGISFEREFELVERALQLREDAVVLDLACGPGIYSRPWAQLASRGRVIGADLSPEMLRTATRHARRESIRNLTFVRADAEQLPLVSGCVSAVSCCGALHLFPNADRALAEVHRVLEPGGRFAIAAYRRRPGALAERMTAMRRARTGMDAFLPEELEARLGAVGFGDVQCLHARGIWLVMSATRGSAADNDSNGSERQPQSQ